MSFVRFKVPDCDNDYAGSGPMTDKSIRIRKLARSGFTWTQIAAKVGVSCRYVRLVLKRRRDNV